MMTLREKRRLLAGVVCMRCNAPVEDNGSCAYCRGMARASDARIEHEVTIDGMQLERTFLRQYRLRTSPPVRGREIVGM